MEAPEFVESAAERYNEDWEPMPNDNLDRVDREPYAVRTNADRPRKRQCVE